MSGIIELREPFRTYFAKLDALHFKPANLAGHISLGGSLCCSFPELDQDDALALSAELNAALLPIIAKFKAKKLAEVMDLMQPAARGSTLVVR